MDIALVTGVAGFIGSHVARELSDRGYMVVGVDSSPPDTIAGIGLDRYSQTQLPDPAFGALLAEVQPEILVHCAGRASVPRSMSQPGDDYRTNTAMTFEVLDSLRTEAPDCHFVFPSSAAVYGNPPSLPVSEDAPLRPLSPYGFHKLQAESLCQEFAVLHGLRTTVLRIFSAYGPGLRRQVVWDVCRKALTEPALNLLGSGTETRDFIHVRDIAAAVGLLAETAWPESHRTLNLASGVETSVADLADMLTRALGLEASAVFDLAETPGMPVHWRADVSAFDALGFRASVLVDDGMAETALWVRDELEVESRS